MARKRRLRRPQRMALIHQAIDRRGGKKDFTFSQLANFAASAKKETAETEQVANDWGTKWP